MRDRERALALLDACSADDPAFLSRAAEALTLALGCRWAGIGQVSSDGRSIDILSIRDREGRVEPFSYPISDSPCAQVYAARPLQPYRAYPDGVTARFSGPDFLSELGARSYRGEAICDAAGDPFAHLFAIDAAPFEDSAEDQLVFRLIGQRVAAVLNHRRTEAALRRSESRFRVIMDNLAEGLFIHTLDGEILDVNNRACEYLDYQRHELIGAYIDKVEVALPIEKILEAWRNAPVGEMQTFEGMHRRRDGAVFPVDVRGRAVDLDGQRLALVSARDMTQIRRTERALTAARIEAETANRAKSDFIANVSHELRTPLNAIIGFSQILSEETFGPIGNERYVQYSGDILRSGRHLLNVISDILDLSKIEAGKATISESMIDLGDLLADTGMLLFKDAEQRGVAIRSVPPESPVTLIADDVKLRQVLINLLANAVKFSPPGEEVVLSSFACPTGGIRIAVADRGPGIPPEEVEQAFETFRRLDPQVRSNVEGTGLGLPIARKLCELHGGTLDLESETGKGTRAVVRLPAERVRRERAAG